MRGKRTERDRVAVGYVRVSTQEQAVEGVSLDAQRQRLEHLALASNHGPVAEWFVDDGFSGSTLDRPAMRRLLARIDRREISAVFVTKLDRLTRNLRDMLELVDRCERAGTALLSASEALDTSSAVGRMVLQVVAAFAEFERGMVSERTSAALAYKRGQRKAYGAVPFGWRREGDDLVAVAEEQAALAEARRLRESGVTLSTIAEMLTARGIKPRGRKWYPSSVAAVLSSRMAQEVVS